jgi:hypothetical protein
MSYLPYNYPKLTNFTTNNIKGDVVPALQLSKVAALHLLLCTRRCTSAPSVSASGTNSATSNVCMYIVAYLVVKILGK